MIKKNRSQTFVSDFLRVHFSNSQTKGPLEERLVNIEMDHEEIAALLRNFRTDKSTMMNNVAPRMLKELIHELAEPIALLLRQLLSMGIVPEDWKSVDVIPIDKKGNRQLAENYRPISLTCIACKIFEIFIRGPRIYYITFGQI